MSQLEDARNALPKNAPIPTFFFKGLASAQARKDGLKRRVSEIPGIDAAAITRRYGKLGAPQADYATFRAPISASPSEFEKLRNAAVRKWLDVKLHDKWDCVLPMRITVTQGIYPARDLLSQKDLWDHREYIIGAWFVPQVPRIQRIELDPELLAPTRLGGN